MTSHARSTAGDATDAFVSWLVTGAVGRAHVALPVNLAAHKLAGMAVSWFKTAKALGVPVVLTTSRDGPNGVIIPELTALFPRRRGHPPSRA